jgi:hypothetical protein
MSDEIIQEVWQAKDAVAARHQYDVRRLVEHLRAEDQAAGSEVVDLRARKIGRERAAQHSRT